MKKKRVGLAAEVRRLRKEVRGLRAEVDLWRDYVVSSHRVIRKSIEAADREFRKKGGIPLEGVIRGLEIRRGRVPREVRMGFLKQSGKEIRTHLEKRGITEEKILAEFKAWRKARRAHRPRK